MIKKNIILSPREILKQQFKIDMNGYRVKEVDRYLDMIIEDYQMFEKIISDLEDRVEDLESENYDLKKRIREYKMKMEIAGDSKISERTSNLDVLRRLSRLENIVFDDDK